MLPQKYIHTYKHIDLSPRGYLTWSYQLAKIQPVVAPQNWCFSLQLGPTPTSYFQPYRNMVTFLKNFGMTPPWFPHLYIKCGWSLGNMIPNCSVGYGFMWYSKDHVKITSTVRVGTRFSKDEHFMQKDKTCCKKCKRYQASLWVSWRLNWNRQAIVTGTDQCGVP